MPRYRLFGDTVQVASLLNATGEGNSHCAFDLFFLFFKLFSCMFVLLAMKIHVSMETKILLDSVGGYFLEPRGLLVIEVRGNREELLNCLMSRAVIRGRRFG